MDQRIVGLETEFGCLVRDHGPGEPRLDNETVVEAVKDHAFLHRRLGLLDLYARDFAFEPARSGGFLLNGGRLYVDAVGSHEEYATPECVDWREAVIYDRAGRCLLQQLLHDLQLEERVAFYANAIDHFGGHTFGCHENYLVHIPTARFRAALAALLPFLVTRQIFAGVGRVGGHRLNHHDFRRNVMNIGEHEVDTLWVADFYGVEIDPTVQYQLSQRADHIVNVVSTRVRFNRAIINPKHDAYFDYSDQHRLHVLFGEPNMNEYANWLKIGSTCLVLDLLDLKLAPPQRLADPLQTLRRVSRDPSWHWLVELEDGSSMGAVDLQRSYLQAAQALRGRDQQTDDILTAWEEVLDGLEHDPMTLGDRVDWVAKRQLLDDYVEAEGAQWGDDVLHSLDLEYHNINPACSLYGALVQAGRVCRIATDAEIEHAINHPPRQTRAAGRAAVIAELLRHKWKRYVIDWDQVRVSEDLQLELRNPFHPYLQEARAFTRELFAGH